MPNVFPETIHWFFSENRNRTQLSGSIPVFWLGKKVSFSSLPSLHYKQIFFFPLESLQLVVMHVSFPSAQ